MTISIDDSLKVQFNANGTVKAIYDIYNGNWALEDFDAEKTFALVGESIIITEYKDGVIEKIETYSPSTINFVDPNPSIAGVILYRSSRTKFDGDDDRNILSGSSYNDDMYCMGGNDDAFGGAGDDNISGGSGNDKIRGGLGKDVINGNIGIDTADYSDKSAAVVVTLAGSQSSTVKIAGVIEDSILNIECLIGGSASDTFVGDLFANQLVGNSGDDNLAGNGGNDNISGGVGNDFMRGGTGSDRLTGGTGADRFRFDTAATKTSSNLDLLTDFSRSVGDKLSFSKAVFGGFGASTGISSTQLRAGAGVIAASNTTQRFLYDTTTGILRFDRDGSGSSYSALQVAKLGSSSIHPTLAYTDFQLS